LPKNKLAEFKKIWNAKEKCVDPTRYLRECNEISQDNEKLLDEFAKTLWQKSFSPKAIKQAP